MLGVEYRVYGSVHANYRIGITAEGCNVNLLGFPAVNLP
jgi:hypothetical protein